MDPKWKGIIIREPKRTEPIQRVRSVQSPNI